MTTAPTSAGPTKDDTRREQPALLRLPYRSELWFVLFLAFFWPLIRTCRDVLLCPVVLCMIWFGAAGGSCCVLFQTRTVSFLCSPSSPCCGGIIPLVGGDTLQEFVWYGFFLCSSLSGECLFPILVVFADRLGTTTFILLRLRDGWSVYDRYLLARRYRSRGRGRGRMRTRTIAKEDSVVRTYREVWSHE